MITILIICKHWFTSSVSKFCCWDTDASVARSEERWLVFFCRLKINASQMMITLKTFWGGGVWVVLGSLSDSKWLKGGKRKPRVFDETPKKSMDQNEITPPPQKNKSPPKNIHLVILELCIWYMCVVLYLSPDCFEYLRRSVLKTRHPKNLCQTTSQEWKISNLQNSFDYAYHFNYIEYYTYTWIQDNCTICLMCRRMGSFS